MKKKREVIIALSHEQIKLLYDMCGGEKATIIIENGNGRSGLGYYAYHFYDAHDDQYGKESIVYLGKDELSV